MKKWLLSLGTVVILGSFIGVAGADNFIKLIVNGKELETDVPPKIVNGRTLVPLRAVAEALDSEVNWDKSTKTVSIQKKDELPKIVSELADNNIRLYAIKIINEFYSGFLVEVNDRYKYYKWTNTTNPTYAPQVIFQDLYQDNKKELIVILTKGYGTGVLDTEVHVLDSETLEEIQVESTSDIVKNKVKSSVSINDGLEIQVGEETYKVPKEELPGDQKNWFSNIGWGGTVNFVVEDNRLYAYISGQVSPAAFVGHLEIVYKYNNGKFEANTIKFKLDR